MRFLLSFVLAALATVAHAQDADPTPHSDARLVAGVASVAPGDAFDLALRIDLEEGWHVYWINPGDSGQPVKVDWQAPEGVVVGPLQFPYPETYTIAGLASYAHEGAPHFLTRVSVPEGYDETSVDIEGRAYWLVCADACIPVEHTVSLSVPVGETVRTDALADARRQLPVMGEGWTAAAETTAEGYRLRVEPPAAWAGSLEGAHFYVSTSGVLDHAAEQTFVRDGQAWTATLPASAYASEPATRLRGVLVGPEGEALADGARAIEIDALVQGVPGETASAGAAGGAAPLGVWSALLFAFAGGLILNLMPCVFPILSIKILGFVQGREASRSALRAHGLAFGAGVILSFLALAGVLLALRAAGEGLGWGFQLQSPLVVAGLAVLMTGLALNLLGVFEVGQGLAAAGGQLDRHEGLGGAFLSGVLATVVATPCTAPFMGAALGFALAQPALVALVVFAALGVGMALPYVLLSFKPGWLEKLPRPGPWMETLKQALAFPLLATAVWLVWVFGLQAGINGAALLLLALVLVGLAAWTWGRWGGYGASARGRWTARAVGAGAVLAALVLVGVAAEASGGAGVASAAESGAEASGDWRPFDSEAVQTLVASGEPVFIDFTAAWCLSCQVNKKVALTTDAVEQAFVDGGITRIRADWTNRDPDITAYLDRFGRTGVPLYVFYPGDGADPVLLPEILTPQIVLDAVTPQTASR